MSYSIQGKHLSYFEAILQLRDITPKMVDFAKNEIRKAGVHVAKVLPVKNGYDYYLGDNAFAKKLGRKLQEQFDGEYAVTASLFSRKEGKALYRLTVLFRALPFQKGDTVSFKGEPHKIISIEKEIFLQKKTGEKVRVKYKDMEQIKEWRE